MSCSRCETLDPEQAAQLESIGGSHDPFNEPYGELMRCGACGQHFRFTHDHDNEIGYQASGKSLETIDRAKALAMATTALAIAVRHRAYFATQDGDWAKHVVGQTAAEQLRLQAAIDDLQRDQS